MKRGGERGSVLAETLAALTLIAAAGMVVVVAASAGLGAVRQATLIQRAVVIAAGDLSALQARGAPNSSNHAVREELALGEGASSETTVRRRGDGVAELGVTVTTPTLRLPVTLATRMIVPN